MSSVNELQHSSIDMMYTIQPRCGCFWWGMQNPGLYPGRYYLTPLGLTAITTLLLNPDMVEQRSRRDQRIIYSQALRNMTPSGVKEFKVHTFLQIQPQILSTNV